jgi:hypothetical protein
LETCATEDVIRVFTTRPDTLFGATYADLYARLPLLGVLAACAMAGAILWLINAFSSGNKAAIGAVVLYVAGLLLVLVAMLPAATAAPPGPDALMLGAADDGRQIVLAHGQALVITLEARFPPLPPRPQSCGCKRPCCPGVPA